MIFSMALRVISLSFTLKLNMKVDSGCRIVDYHLLPDQRSWDSVIDKVSEELSKSSGYESISVSP